MSPVTDAGHEPLSDRQYVVLLVRLLLDADGHIVSYWGVDRNSGAMVAVSTWDTGEHADFSRDALIGAAGVGAGPGAERRIADAAFQMDPAEIYELAAQVL